RSLPAAERGNLFYGAERIPFSFHLGLLQFAGVHQEPIAVGYAVPLPQFPCAEPARRRANAKLTIDPPRQRGARILYMGQYRNMAQVATSCDWHADVHPAGFLTLGFAVDLAFAVNGLAPRLSFVWH